MSFVLGGGFFGFGFWAGEGEREREIENGLLTGWVWGCRVEFDGADYEFVGVSVYGVGGVVGGGQGDFQR